MWGRGLYYLYIILFLKTVWGIPLKEKYQPRTGGGDVYRKAFLEQQAFLDGRNSFQITRCIPEPEGGKIPRSRCIICFEDVRDIAHFTLRGGMRGCLECICFNLKTTLRNGQDFGYEATIEEWLYDFVDMGVLGEKTRVPGQILCDFMLPTRKRVSIIKTKGGPMLDIVTQRLTDGSPVSTWYSLPFDPWMIKLCELIEKHLQARIGLVRGVEGGVEDPALGPPDERLTEDGLSRNALLTPRTRQWGRSKSSRKRKSIWYKINVQPYMDTEESEVRGLRFRVLESKVKGLTENTPTLQGRGTMPG
ncbi:uncharacterized protein LOC133138220 [Conger conger]|uniref:uncharacterized protein LOC133138220 n=1 Tax=Conger conger TaxID=82655 RepID=UPI002A59F03A|nr:uncharacterized protein LOC133138220 [Conger conger]